MLCVWLCSVVGVDVCVLCVVLCVGVGCCVLVCVGVRCCVVLWLGVVWWYVCAFVFYCAVVRARV